MKATLLEQFGSKQGIKKKQPSQVRIQKMLKKKRLKKAGKYDNTTKPAL